MSEERTARDRAIGEAIEKARKTGKPYSFFPNGPPDVSGAWIGEGEGVDRLRNFDPFEGRMIAYPDGSVREAP